MINGLELIQQAQNQAADQEYRRSLADLANRKFAIEQQMVPGQLEGQRLSNLSKQMEVQAYPQELARKAAQQQALLEIQRQGAERQNRALQQNEQYRQEQLKLKRLELDPFGMLGANPSAQTKTPQPNDVSGKGANEGVLANVAPPIAQQVKALADGRMAFPSGFALKTPYWQKMLSLVADYDPSFDAVNYNARAKTRADMTSGVGARNLTAINTAIGHLDSLDKAATALNNSDYPTFNTAINAIGPAVGNTNLAGRIRTFQQSKEAVANELMRVFRGTGASTADTKAWAETINAADSPAALKASVKSAVDLLKSRIGALNEQYSRGMGKSTDVTDFINPKSKATLERLGGEKQNNPIFDQADKIIGK